MKTLWLWYKIDDLDDANILDSLMDQFPPPNILVYSTEELIGLSPEHVVKCCQSFTQVAFCFDSSLKSLYVYICNRETWEILYHALISVSDVARKNSSFVKRFIKRVSEASVLNIFQITKTKTLYHLLIGL